MSRAEFAICWRAMPLWLIQPTGQAPYRAAMGKPLLCRLGWHEWVVRRTGDNKRYRQCVRCHKDDDGSYDGMSFSIGG